MRLSFLLFIWIVLTCGQGLAEEQYYPWPNYTVSPTGRFIAATYRARIGNTSRLVILDTATPASRQVVGDDYPEYPGVAFSSDEQWVLVVDEATSSSETDSPSVKLLRLGSGAKFEPAPSPEFRDLVAGIGGADLSVRSAQWESGSPQFVLLIMKHVEPDLDNLRVWQIRAEATEPKQPGHILAVDKYTENNLRAFEQKGISQNVEDQLNAVYNVLRKNLEKSEQNSLIEDERKWLKDREKLPLGFDQSFFTERRVQELVRRVIIRQGTANHLDTPAQPSLAELERQAQGTDKWKILLLWQNRSDTWQPDDGQAAVSADGALAVVYWRDANFDRHLDLGRLTNKTLYRFDRESPNAMQAKILAAILKTHNLTAASCDSSTLTPDHWEDAENVVINGQAAGQNDELASYQLNGWTVLYDVKKQEVAKILNGGTFEADRNGTAQPNGKDENQDIELPEVGSWVSPDGILRLVGRHLSTGNWLDLIALKENGEHFADSINADGPVFKDAFAFHGLSQADLGDHYGTSFEGWSGRAHRFIVGLHFQLGLRGPHGAFYQFGGWSGVYDPDKNQVVEQLTPGSIWEPM